VEILSLLQQIGEKLSPAEIKFLQEKNIQQMPDGKYFEKVSEESGKTYLRKIPELPKLFQRAFI